MFEMFEMGVRNVRNVRNGGKKCSFFGKFGVLCFLVTSILRFALLPYYLRFLFAEAYSESCQNQR